MPVKPFIIPIFLPHRGCPHQCIFCNQSAITGQTRKILSESDFQMQADTFLAHRRSHRTDVQIAFYGGNFLGIAPVSFQTLLGYAQKYIQAGEVNGIRFSTRPETIRPEAMEVLRRFSVTDVELGVQSMDDQVLRLSQRGHTAMDTIRAVDLLKRSNYRIGLQMMVGLPGDSAEASIATAREVIRLKPDFVRIYPTVVLAGSPLADWVREGTYHPLSLETSVTLVKQLYLLFEQSGIPVARMGLQTSETLSPETVIAGPFHPAFGHLVHSEIFLDLAVEALKAATSIQGHAVIRAHPRSVSRVHGEKNRNIKLLCRMFALESLIVKPDASLPENHVAAGPLPQVTRHSHQ
ncbi:MAG: elongator complex protein 3 [Thermodesulfobacteriota bacterium]